MDNVCIVNGIYIILALFIYKNILQKGNKHQKSFFSKVSILWSERCKGEKSDGSQCSRRGREVVMSEMYCVSHMKQSHPTSHPTSQPNNNQNNNPTSQPTDKPNNNPTDKPNNNPTNNPTDKPTDNPTDKPTDNPTNKPTDNPTNKPNNNQNNKPTNNQNNNQNNNQEEKKEVWCKEIQGILYYIDEKNQIYNAEDIVLNKQEMKPIGKYENNVLMF